MLVWLGQAGKGRSSERCLASFVGKAGLSSSFRLLQRCFGVVAWRSDTATLFLNVKMRTSKCGELSHCQSILFSDCGFAIMKYSSIPRARTALTTFAARKNTSFFARILESLHHSRRLQAQRFLQTHRHLIHGGRDSRFKPNAGGGDNGDR